jgi:2-amino-4-hydroxy-6-hydroxymethyldihydropteridine diphosphokinase
LSFSAVVGFGANLGDRLTTMRAAARELRRTARILKTSHVYVTAPVGPHAQPDFLNAAALVLHPGTAEDLLDALVEVEVRLGRVRGAERWGPRTIDLDILWGDGVVVQTERLQLPHPELHARAFALVPLLELVPNAVDPTTGARYLVPRADVRITADIL